MCSLLLFRSELTTFINEKEEYNGINKGNQDSIRGSHMASSKSRFDVEKEAEKKIEENGVRGNDTPCRDEKDFEGVYRASREVVLQALLSRAGVRNLGPGPHQ